jgi:streptomycin 6-kinase
MTYPVRLQPLTRAKVNALGAAGAAWAAALPEVLAQLEELWAIKIGRAIPGGSASYVARATTENGDEAVVKIAITDEGLAQQVTTLDRAAGRGYVRLFAADLDRKAILLEALGPSLQRSAKTPEEQLTLLAETVMLAWEDPEGRRPPRGEDKASSLHDLIGRLWNEVDHRTSAEVLNQAMAYAERLAFVADSELVVVHGDPHPGNLLLVPRPRAGAETGYCFVDPDGFVADRAYDLGVMLRDWTTRLRQRDDRATLEGYCDLLAGITDVDPTRIWQWGFVERVSTGLYLMSFGAEAAGAPYLRTAELLLDDDWTEERSW